MSNYMRVYVKQPLNFEDPQKPHVCLKKVFYGLKKSFSIVICHPCHLFFYLLGIHRSHACLSLLHIKDSTHTYLLIYVDGILIKGNNPTVTNPSKKS